MGISKDAKILRLLNEAAIAIGLNSPIYWAGLNLVRGLEISPDVAFQEMSDGNGRLRAFINAMEAEAINRAVMATATTIRYLIYGERPSCIYVRLILYVRRVFSALSRKSRLCIAGIAVFVTRNVTPSGTNRKADVSGITEHVILARSKNSVNG